MFRPGNHEFQLDQERRARFLSQVERHQTRQTAKQHLASSQRKVAVLLVTVWHFLLR